MSTELFTFHSPLITYPYFSGNCTTSHLSTTHLHDSANRLLEDDSFFYSYDANGNRIEKRPKTCPSPPAPCPEATTYIYDVENQLTQVEHTDPSTQQTETATYRYDALGRRIEKAQEIW